MLWHPKTLQNLAMYNVFFIFGRFSIAGKLPKWPKIPFQYPLALRHPKILEKCRKHHRILVSVRNRFWPPPAKADIATAILTNVIEHLVLLFCPPISTPSPPKRCGRIFFVFCFFVFHWFWGIFGPRLQKPRENKKRPMERVWGEAGQVTWGETFFFPWVLEHLWAKVAKTSRKKVSTLGEGLKKNWTGDLKWFPKFTWWIITSHTWLLVFGFWFYHGFGAFWAKRGHKLRWFGPVGFNLRAVSAQLVSKVMQLRHVWMQIGFNVRSLVLRAGPGHTVGNTAYH